MSLDNVVPLHREKKKYCKSEMTKYSFLNDFWKKTAHFRKNVVIKLVEGVLFREQ